jgi:hypothetical protein
MFSRCRVIRYVPMLALLAAVALPAAPGLAQRTGVQRTVVIGDIHGDFEGLTGILRQAGITDASGRWVAGTTTVVQTGDMTDRGARVRAVLDLLMDLEQQAKAAGGRLVVLLGNHEVMNLAGNFRDVTPEIYASFADARSEERRRQAYQAYVRLCDARAKLFTDTPPAAFLAVSRDEWMAAYPPGAIEYREAFGPRGRYGRWLRGKAAVWQLGKVVFMHAGINPANAPRRLDDINKQVSNEIQAVDDYRRRMAEQKLILPWFDLKDVVTAAQIDASNLGKLLQIDRWMLFDPEGPMWFRGFAMWPPEEAAPRIKMLLERYDIAGFVVGHTVTKTRRITPQFSNAVFLIDTGMVFSDGAASALEIQDGRFTAIDPDGRTILVELPNRDQAPAPHRKQQE